MSFLAPLFLLGALALAAPVVFHLIRRTTRQRTPFSSLMFLRSSPPRLTKRSRLEHLLLLLLRCLALALVAFAFARPFVKEAVVAETDAGAAKRLVVLVDVSASMQREGLWTAARERAAGVLRPASAGDRVAVLTFGRQVGTLVGFDEWTAAPVEQRVALATGRLADTAPGWSGTQLGDALVQATELLADTGDDAIPGPRQIVVISDLQSGSRLEAIQSLEWPRGVELVLEPVGARPATNASLHLLADAADVERPAEPTVRVRVSNAPDATREQFQVGWQRPDGSSFGEVIETYVPPGQSRVVTLPVPADAAAPTEIVLRGDDVPFDNRVFVIPPQPQQINVLYFGTEAAGDIRQPRFFLERALTATPSLAVRVTAQPPAQPLSATDARDAALFVVTESLPAARADEMRSLALEGKTVLVAPQSPEVAPTLARLVGVAGLGMEEARPARYAMLAEIDFRHPLFLPFADPRFSDFTKIHIWRHRRLDASAIPDSRVVAKFDSGDPALIEVPVGRGRVVVLTAGWAPDDSQLAVSSKFVPLLYSLLEWSGGIAPPLGQHLVGDALTLPSSAGSLSVRRPDGTVVELPAGATRYEDTAVPGVYAVLAGGVPTVRFAVNLDPVETRLAPLATDEFEQLGAPVTRPTVDPAREAERKVVLRGMETESRQKLWRWFIGATLLVLLIESILAGRTARRTSIPGVPAS